MLKSILTTYGPKLLAWAIVTLGAKWGLHTQGMDSGALTTALDTIISGATALWMACTTPHVDDAGKE